MTTAVWTPVDASNGFAGTVAQKASRSRANDRRYLDHRLAAGKPMCSGFKHLK